MDLRFFIRSGPEFPDGDVLCSNATADHIIKLTTDLVKANAEIEELLDGIRIDMGYGS